MLKPLSTIGACCLGYAALGVYAREDSAISPEAARARVAAYVVVESAERSQALFGEKAVAISQVRKLANECSEKGWDGDEAMALDPLAVAMVESLLRALPESIPLPEFAPEPDGSVSLDWIQAKNRLFSVSVSAANRLAFAWLDGSDKGHGVARFDGETISPRILTGIESIMNYGNASIRAA